jgi:hypothetical protein
MNENIVGAVFGLTLSLLLAEVHIRAFRSPDATVVTRFIHRWYARWWRPEDTHGIVGFMSAACLFMTLVCLGALAYELIAR